MCDVSFVYFVYPIPLRKKNAGIIDRIWNKQSTIKDDVE